MIVIDIVERLSVYTKVVTAKPAFLDTTPPFATAPFDVLIRRIEEVSCYQASGHSNAHNYSTAQVLQQAIADSFALYPIQALILPAPSINPTVLRIAVAFLPLNSQQGQPRLQDIGATGDPGQAQQASRLIDKKMSFPQLASDRHQW